MRDAMRLSEESRLGENKYLYSDIRKLEQALGS